MDFERIFLKFSPVGVFFGETAGVLRNDFSIVWGLRDFLFDVGN